MTAVLTSLVLLTTAVAAMVWPVRAVGVGAPRRRAGVGRLRRPSGPWVVVACLLGALVVGVAAGWALGVATAIVALTTAQLATRQARRRRVVADRQELAALLSGLVRELRAGTDPTGAVRSVAGTDGRVARQLAVIAAGTTTVPESGTNGIGVTDLVAALGVSAVYGVPLAALVQVIADDAAAATAADEARTALVAGPRFSGYVLAALPLFGVLLGSGIGADPLQVLFGGGTAGSMLLVVGTALVCAGLLWSARIVGG